MYGEVIKQITDYKGVTAIGRSFDSSSSGKTGKGSQRKATCRLPEGRQLVP